MGVLQDNELILEPDRIWGLLEKGCRDGATLELQLDRQQVTYLSTLVEVFKPQEGAGGPAAGDSGLLIAPLEPAVGNMKIRASATVTFQFVEEVHLLRSSSQFKGVMARENGRLIGLTLPRVMQVHAKRKESRISVAPDLEMKVVVRRVGKPEFSAFTLDINKGGMGMESPPLDSPMNKGERVSMELTCKGICRDAVMLSGVVCFQARVRTDSGEGGGLRDRFGVQFITVSLASSMQLDRLVETMRKRARA